MKENNEKLLRNIRKAVFESLKAEINAKLDIEVSDKAKRKEISGYTLSRLSEIVNSLTENELMPQTHIDSKQDFEKSILRLIQLVRERLIEEVKSEHTKS